MRLSERLQVPPSELLAAATEEELAATARGPETGEGREEIAAHLRAAQLLTRQGRADEAIPLLREVLTQATTSRDRALAHFYLASHALDSGDAMTARRELSDALPLAEQLSDPELRERIHLALGDAELALGHPLDALAYHRASWEAIRRGIMREKRFQLEVLGRLAEDYLRLGEAESAVARLEEALALANQMGDADEIGDLYRQLSAAYAARGETAGAKRAALQSIAGYESVGDRRAAAAAHTRLARVYLAAGQLEEAEAHLGVARAQAEKLDDPVGVAAAATGLGEVALRREQYAESEREAAVALAAAERSGDVIAQSEALLLRAAALEGQRQRRPAETQMKQAIRLLERAGEPARGRLALAYARLSELYEQRNDPAHALEWLKRAADLTAAHSGR
jgi:tetratricopeptide (TPR) repeat protein